MQKWVMVVDDSADSARTMTALLSLCDCQVRVASSGKEALELIAVVRFDLILADLVMPEMDGYALIADLRRRKLLGETKVYAMTGQPVSREELAAAGSQGLIQKPVILEQLQSILKLDC